MRFYFLQQIYCMLLLTDHASVLATLYPAGESIPRIPFDLNEFPPDASPTTPRFGPLQSTPDASKKDSVAQSDQVGLHSSTSTSKIFPVNDRSTNPLKRKNVDASIEQGQPMAPIDLDQRQKTSIKYQNNWLVENPSQPEGMTATTAKLQQKEKQKIENFKNRQNDPCREIRLSRLEENERKHVPFDVQDWSFVKKKSNTQTDEESQGAFKENYVVNLFQVMREIKREIEIDLFKKERHQTSNEYFWIPKEYSKKFTEVENHLNTVR
ncbi:hypothetical protein PtB15_1B831 [Puccinia triticina]|nr:hypothetical protein PtB15_1B831 [Puccinia triticina]